jgi:signal transduction histidine kinase
LRIAAGRPPALLAERGLDGAIGALVLTAGLPVRVIADPCSDLPAPLQRAIWFTASEAVTNALKHAHAASLDLSLRRQDGTVTLIVRDDGRGGVDRPPAALAARVNEAGGRLAVESNGHGTLVRAEFTTVRP